MNFILPFAGGVAAALVNIVIAGRLPRKRAAEFFNLFMAATSAFYFGSALALGNGKTLAVETAVGAVLFALALAGQWWSLKFTAIAFVAHGAWDLAHTVLGAGANAGQVFPVICVAYDWVIAGYLWWMASAGDKAN
ncbi:MAG TPA: DUF6010 family protein [Candidatus Angelobacter sp.]|nr:DUF6010 family protein [Candidatus Angelobacter sp.]